jgi:hypothetical protein
VGKFLHAGIIPTLVELASSGPSRKVVRMCIGTLRNLAETNDADALTEMLTVGVQRLLESISQAPKSNPDPEFDSDVRILGEILALNFRELSTFDKWVSQIHSGNLRPGVVHQERFWRENARFVEQEDFKLLRQLISFLRHEDPVRDCLFNVAFVVVAHMFILGMC